MRKSATWSTDCADFRTADPDLLAGVCGWRLACYAVLAHLANQRDGQRRGSGCAEMVIVKVQRQTADMRGTAAFHPRVAQDVGGFDADQPGVVADAI